MLELPLKISGRTVYRAK